jgi:hypothetical protein
MLDPRRDAALLDLGADSDGVVHLTTCKNAGITSERLRWLVDGGRWQRVHPRVFATFSGPLPPSSRRSAALLYAGADAALSHHTAAELWG